MYEADDPWKAVGKKFAAMSQPGEFSSVLSRVDARREWEYRAVVEHPKVRLYGQAVTLRPR